mgnify:CR=1 FL=1
MCIRDSDPLAAAIEEAHSRGLELHAWFNVFQTSSTYDGSPAAEHPEWICRDQNGTPMSSYRSLSPGLKDVRNYTIKVAMEIVRNYDIDGLHLDYVRYCDVILPIALQPKYYLVQKDEMPQYDFGYHKEARREYKKIYNVDPIKIEDPQSVILQIHGFPLHCRYERSC